MFKFQGLGIPGEKKKKKRRIEEYIKVSGERSLYSDLLNVARSQYLYGQATHPGKATIRRFELYKTEAFRTPTIERLKEGLGNKYPWKREYKLPKSTGLMANLLKKPKRGKFF